MLKFGSLSNIEGFVTVRWKVSEEPEPRFVMTWREPGGPSVSSPRRKGFGHTAMIRMIEYAFDADVMLNYDPEGVTWNMSAPLAAVLEESNSSAVLDANLRGDSVAPVAIALQQRGSHSCLCPATSAFICRKLFLTYHCCLSRSNLAN
jgi:hypothetical protein